MTTVTDAELVTRAAAGDRDAYTDLCRRHIDTVHDHIARWSRDHTLAADATQEAFVALLANLGTLRDGQAVLAWLLRTARNRAIDQLRRTQRETSADPTPDGRIGSALLSAPSTDPAGDPVAATERTEAAELVWEVAAGLDERTFTVLDLSVRQGLNGPELAEVLDTTPSNANVLVHRMRERMKSLFGAVLLLRSPDTDACEELAALRDQLSEPVDTAGARALHRHADDCAVCGETRRAAIAPMQAYAAFAQVRAPQDVHDRLAALADAHFGTSGGSGSGSAGRRLGVVGALLTVLVLLGLWTAFGVGREGPPSATGEPLASATPSPEASPPVDEGGTTGPSERPTIETSPAPEPSPSPSTTASPTPSPTPSPSPTELLPPLAVEIVRPTTGATSVVEPEVDENEREVGLFPVEATVSGGSGEHTVAWFSRAAETDVLATTAVGEVALWLSDPCTDTTHELVVRVTDAVTEGTAETSVRVTVLHDCPPPLVVSVRAPADGSSHTADDVRTIGAERRTGAEIDVSALAEGSDPSDLSWTWTSDEQEGVLLEAAAGTIFLTYDDPTCQPILHTLTVEAIRGSDGAVGSTQVEITVEPGPTCIT